MQKHYTTLKRGILSILPLSAMLLSSLIGAAQNKPTKDTTSHMLEEVIISASRADYKTPLTTSTLQREELDEAKIQSSIPYMLNLLPSVVATGENGTVGNTNMRIRGIDATRINVNINGISLNDPESQGVFWVNIPNLAGMSQSLQVQRGIGAGNAGGASFGGSINLQTLNARSMPYATADLGYGSWNTRQYGIAAGTGIGKKGFFFDAAYNGLTSDGYVRGGTSDMQSLFLTGGYYGNSSILKAVVILGQQLTGICWNGADSATLNNDPTYNDVGYYEDDKGNVHYYPDQEKYRQQHYQLYYSYLMGDSWTLSAALDYTHGFGYDERYKYNKGWNYCGMTQPGSVAKTDFIFQKLMNNNAVTESLSAQFKSNKLTLTFGESLLLFAGDHYGEVLWTKDSSMVTPDKRFTNWYSNTGKKKDANVYVRMNYDFSSRSNIYADLSFRYVDFSITGEDEDKKDGYAPYDYHKVFPFFNPKVGWNYMVTPRQRFYAVAGISNREPTRSDIKEAEHQGTTMEAERMLDIEAGYALTDSRYTIRANAYAMLYKDQLTPTGMYTPSNYPLMINVDKSYRIGLELEGGYRFTDWFNLNGNFTLSTNKVVDYDYTYMSGVDAAWNPVNTTVNLGTTDLAFSPAVVGAAIAAFHPCRNWEIELIGKYVGKQYCDNTSREEMAQDAYFLLDFRTAYTWRLENGNEFELQGMVNNVLNHNYRTNAWASYGYDWSSAVVFSRGYFQQPGTHFAIRAIARF